MNSRTPTPTGQVDGVRALSRRIAGTLTLNDSQFILSGRAPFLNKQYAMTSSVANRRLTDEMTCSTLTAVEMWDKRIQILSVRDPDATALRGDEIGSVPVSSSGSDVLVCCSLSYQWLQQVNHQPREC